MKIFREEAEKFLKENVFKLENSNSISFNICELRNLKNENKLSVNIQSGKLAVIEGSLREATHSDVVGLRLTYMSGTYFNYRWEQCCYLEIDKIDKFCVEKFSAEYAKLRSIELATCKSIDRFLVMKIDDEKFVAFYLLK